MKKLTLLLLALLYVTLTYAYTERDLLQKQADINRLKEILVLDRQWVTYPDYNAVSYTHLTLPTILLV